MQTFNSNISDIKEDVKDFGFSNNLKPAAVRALTYLWQGKNRDFRDLCVLDCFNDLTGALEEVLVKINSEAVKTILTNLENWKESLIDNHNSIMDEELAHDNHLNILYIESYINKIKAFIENKNKVVEVKVKQLSDKQVKFLCAIARNWNRWTHQEAEYGHGYQLSYLSALNQIDLLVKGKPLSFDNHTFHYLDEIPYLEGKKIIDLFTSGQIKDYVKMYKAQVA